MPWPPRAKSRPPEPPSTELPGEPRGSAPSRAKARAPRASAPTPPTPPAPDPAPAGPSTGRAGGPAAGLTVRDVARRYRVGEDKVRTWIARGELKAINTAAALCGRPRWIVPVEA